MSYGGSAFILFTASWFRQYVDMVCGLNVTLTSINKNCQRVSWSPLIKTLCSIYCVTPMPSTAAGTSSIAHTLAARAVCRALREGANNNCNFANRNKWLIIIINESIYPLLFTFSIFDDDCVRVIILHYTMRTAVFSTRMIELVQISFRMERVFVVVYSIHSSSAIFGK